MQVVVEDSLPAMAYISLLEAYVIMMNLLLISNAVEVGLTQLYVTPSSSARFHAGCVVHLDLDDVLKECPRRSS